MQVLRPRFTALASLALLLAGAPLAAESIVPGPTFSRVAAMGGYHAALADDFSTLFSNPAGLSRAPRELFASQVGLRLSGPVSSMALGLLDSGGDILGYLPTLISANGGKFYLGTELAGPVGFGFVGNGLGFGLFNATRAVIDARSLTSIDILAGEEVLLVGGYSLPIELGGGHLLDLGIMAKGLARGEVSVETGLVDLMSVIGNPLGQPFRLVTGIGLDLGIRWSWKSLAAGLACRDAWSPIRTMYYTDALSFASDPVAAHVGMEGPVDSLIPADLSLGFAWSPTVSGIMDSFVLALDWRDILDLLRPIPRNMILNISLGAEARVLDIILLRAGLSDALPSLGMAMDLGLFRLNLGIWGEELGIDPGQRPTYNLQTSVEFRY